MASWAKQWEFFSSKLDRHSCAVLDHVSCHAVDLHEQEARLRTTAIQQAETALANFSTTVHIARLAQRAIRQRVITCTTPSKDWPHPQHGRVNKGAAKYRTTRQVCSIDKLSFVPRYFPHMRSLSILGSTPDRDRCASASLDVSGRLLWEVHDTDTADATYAWRWLCCINLSLIEPSLLV